ncbi:MAG: helix-turn-helix domain-containing protein [Chloroflexia bacterium]|nr:helix-turn-helix domain-containing protein [Chloroflexia bacterium]
MLGRTLLREGAEPTGIGLACPRSASQLYPVDLRVVPPPPSQRDNARALWEQGMSQTEIAQTLGISRQRVWQLLRGR